MGFLDFAKEIETQGAEQYSNLAAAMPVRELSAIFKFMAEEEKRHYDLFDSWQRKAKTPSLPDGAILGKAKDAFASLADHFMVNHYFPPINYEQAYDKALLLENKSIALYEEALPKVQDPENQSVLKMIIDQEHAHARFITALMEFLRHPGQWLENAEWHHLEEY